MGTQEMYAFFLNSLVKPFEIYSWKVPQKTLALLIKVFLSFLLEMQLSGFAVLIAVKTLSYDRGPVLVATSPASQPCSCQLSFPYSGLKSFPGTCFK